MRYLILCILISISSVCLGQKVSYIHPVYVSINDEAPLKHSYVFGDVVIHFKKMDINTIYADIINNAKTEITYLPKESYNVTMGKTAQLFSAAKEDEQRYLHGKIIIAPNSTITEWFSPSNMFDVIYAKREFKQHGEPLKSKIVIAFDINGEIKKFNFNIETYPKKSKEMDIQD